MKSTFPNASSSFRKLNPSLFSDQVGRAASGAVAEPSVGPASHADRPVKARHSRQRIVRITCYRAKHVQDPDNGIYKWHIDAIRRAGLVDDDTAQAIRLEIQPEVKVATLEEERTEIEIA